MNNRLRVLFLVLNYIFSLSIATVHPRFVWGGKLYDISPTLPILYGVTLGLVAIVGYWLSGRYVHTSIFFANLAIIAHIIIFITFSMNNFTTSLIPSITLYSTFLLAIIKGVQ